MQWWLFTETGQTLVTATFLGGNDLTSRPGDDTYDFGRTFFRILDESTENTVCLCLRYLCNGAVPSTSK